MVTITDDNFAALTASGLTLVDFSAPWCPPCRMFAPIFEAAADRRPAGVRFGTCNVDDNPSTAGLLQVMSIPTLVVFGPDGSELERRVGAMSRAALDRMVADLSERARPTT